jgi:hypothetical protein
MAREAVVVLSYCCAVSQRSQLSGAYRVESAPHQVTDPRSRHRAADTGLWPFSAGRFPNGAWRAVTFSSALRCPLPRCRTSHIWSVSEAAAAPPDARHVRPAPHARHQPSARRVSKGTFRYRVTRGARCEVRGARCEQVRILCRRGSHRGRGCMQRWETRAGVRPVPNQPVAEPSIPAHSSCC